MARRLLLEPERLRGLPERFHEHALGIEGEIRQAELVVGIDHEQEGLLELGRAGVVLQRVHRAVDGRDVGAAIEVVACDVILVRGEPVSEIHHALAGVVGVAALGEAPEQLLEGRERRQRVFRRPDRQVDVEHPLENVRRLVEEDAPLHVKAVVDTRVRRVLAFEFLGGLDRGLRLLTAVVEIDEIELGLAREVAEGIARFELLEHGDRAGVVTGLHGFEAAVVEAFRAEILDDLVAAAATGKQAHRTGGQH